MEKLLSKKDTKNVVKALLGYLREINNSRKELESCKTAFGNEGLELLPNLSDQIFADIQQLICPSEVETHYTPDGESYEYVSYSDFLDNIIFAFEENKITFEEAWELMLNILCDKEPSKKQNKIIKKLY